jgi:hypothetical protein
LTGIVLQKRRFKLDRDCPSEEEEEKEIQT